MKSDVQISWFVLSFFTQICTLAVRESLANVSIIHLLSVKLWFITSSGSLLHSDHDKALDFLLLSCSGNRYSATSLSLS